MDDVLELKSAAGRPEPPSRLPSAFLLHFGAAGPTAQVPQSAMPPRPHPPLAASALATNAPLDFALSPFSLEGFSVSGAAGNPFSLEGLGFGILDPSVGRPQQ
jgi:hypothetical protein